MKYYIEPIFTGYSSFRNRGNKYNPEAILFPLQLRLEEAG
jgi:hypothetical protein